MEKIVISAKARMMLDELVEILYNEDYFSHKTTAQDYVNNIYDFILTIPALRHKPNRNTFYGTYYCKYKHNNKTSWYFLFDVEDEYYLIKNITNNHSQDYVRFISFPE